MRVLLALVPFLLVGAVVGATYPRYHRERTACEAQGRFYWRGNCLPNECKVIYP